MLFNAILGSFIAFFVLLFFTKQLINLFTDSDKGGKDAALSLVLGLVSLGVWLFPIVGLLVSINGILSGISGSNSSSRKLAIAGMIVSIIGLLAAAMNSVFGAYLGYTGQLFPAPTSTSIPTLTRTPRPTYEPPPTSKATSPCIHWSKITPQLKGGTVCVYGNTSRIVEYVGAWQIRFGSDKDFFLAGGTYYYPDIKIDDCVSAKGIVLLSSEGVPYINIDQNNVYFCEPWMEQ